MTLGPSIHFKLNNTNQKIGFVQLLFCSLAALMVSTGCTEVLEIRQFSAPFGSMDAKPVITIVRDSETLTTVLKDLCGGSATSYISQIKVNWENEMLAIVFPGPKTSSGYKVTLDRVENASDKTTIFYKLKSPADGDQVNPIVECPMMALVLKRTDNPVQIIEAK
jgi:hypothetical protein